MTPEDWALYDHICRERNIVHYRTYEALQYLIDQQLLTPRLVCIENLYLSPEEEVRLLNIASPYQEPGPSMQETVDMCWYELKEKAKRLIKEL